MKLLFALALIIIGLVSCSEPRVISKPKSLVETSFKKDNSNLDKKLSELVVKAKANGSAAIDYLSTDFFLKASHAQMEGDHDLAKVLFKHLIELVPSDDFIKTKYAVSLISTGELQQSEKYLTEIYQNSKGKNTRVGLVLAGVYSTLGNVKKARTVYRKVLVKEPKNEDACIFLSKSYFVENKYKSAKSVLRNCQKKNPKNPIYSYYIGKLYIDRGKISKADYWFKRSLKVKSDYSKAVLAVGLINEERGKNRKAIKIYKKHLVAKPNDSLILNRLVQVLFIEEKFKDIIPYAERLTDLRPDDLNLKVKLGILYTDSKKYDKAVSTFKDLLELAPESDKLHYYLGAIYQEKDDYEKSIEHFSSIDDSSALFHDSVIQIANMLSGLAVRVKGTDKFDTAFDKFNEYTLKKKVKDPTMLLEMSVIRSSYFDKNGEYSKAISELETVVQMETFTDKHRYFLAAIYDRKKDFESSEKLLKLIIDSKPNDANALNFLGYSYLERGVNLNEAYSLIKKAVSLRPKDGYIRDSLGWYYFKQGNTKKALKEVSKAKKLIKNDPTINRHLAEIYLKLKRMDKAKKYISEALKHSKSDAEKTELNAIYKRIESERLPASKK